MRYTFVTEKFFKKTEFEQNPPRVDVQRFVLKRVIRFSKFDSYKTLILSRKSKSDTKIRVKLVTEIARVKKCTIVENSLVVEQHYKNCLQIQTFKFKSLHVRPKLRLRTPPSDRYEIIRLLFVHIYFPTCKTPTRFSRGKRWAPISRVNECFFSRAYPLLSVRSFIFRPLYAVIRRTPSQLRQQPLTSTLTPPLTPSPTPDRRDTRGYASFDVATKIEYECEYRLTDFKYYKHIFLRDSQTVLGLDS